MVPAIRKEPHFLDWRWNMAGCNDAGLRLADRRPAADATTKLISLEPQSGCNLQQLRAQWLKFFAVDALRQDASLLTGEATPSYLLAAPLAAPRLRALAPKARLVIILRNPTERAVSHYNMTVDDSGSDQQLRNRGYHDNYGQTFVTVVHQDLAALVEAGVVPLANAVASDSSCDKVSDALEQAAAFENRYLAGDRLAMQHGGHSFVGRGLYASQLRAWLRLFDPEQMLVVSMELLDTSPNNRDTLQATMSLIQRHVGLSCKYVEDPEPHNQRSGAASASADKKEIASLHTKISRPPGDETTEQEYMSTIKHLMHYYRPHTVDLCSLLETTWPHESVKDVVMQQIRKKTLASVRKWV